MSPAMEAEQKGRWAGAGGPPVGGTTGRRQGGAIGPSSFLSWSIRGGEEDRQSGSLPHLFLCTSDGWIKFRTSTTMWGPNFRRPRRRCGRSRPTRARSGRPWRSSRRPARTSTMSSAPPLPRSSSALGGLDGDTQLQVCEQQGENLPTCLNKILGATENPEGSVRIRKESYHLLQFLDL